MGAEQESGMGQKFNKDEKLKHSLSPKPRDYPNILGLGHKNDFAEILWLTSVPNLINMNILIDSLKQRIRTNIAGEIISHNLQLPLEVATTNVDVKNMMQSQGTTAENILAEIERLSHYIRQNLVR
jgi:hypothetical protein